MKQRRSISRVKQALSRLVCGVFATLFLPLVAVNASAQIQIGTVRVTVTDPSAAVVGGASVTLLNQLTGYTQLASTDDQGGAVFNNQSESSTRNFIVSPRNTSN